MQTRDFVMIMGMPRSGTTWLGKIFDSHPDVLYRHEPDVGIPPPSADAPRDAWIEYVERLLNNRSVRCATKAPWYRKRYRSSLQSILRAPMLQACRALGHAFRDFSVPDLIQAPSRPRFVLKSVNCSSVLSHVASTATEAHGIGILRHPCGYIASVIRGTRAAMFGGAIPATEDLSALEFVTRTEPARARGLTLEALAGMSPVERLAWRWVGYNHALLSTLDGVHNVIVIRYEDLCEDPPGVARDLLHFANLEWHPQTAEFVRLSTRSESAAFFSVFKNPTVAARKWRQELSPDEIRSVLDIVKGTRAGAYYAGTRWWPVGCELTPRPAASRARLM